MCQVGDSARDLSQFPSTTRHARIQVGLESDDAAAQGQQPYQEEGQENDGCCAAEPDGDGRSLESLEADTLQRSEDLRHVPIDDQVTEGSCACLQWKSDGQLGQWVD